MLSRPLTLNDSDDRGRGLVAVTPPPVLPLVNEGDDNGPQTGFFSPSWSSSPSSPPPPCGSSSSSSLVPSLTCPSSFLSFPSSSIPPPLPRPSVSFMSSVSPVSPPLAPSLPSTPAAPPSIHPSPPSFSSPPASVSVALSPHDSSPLAPPLPPASCISLPPPSATTSPLSSSAHIHPSLISPPVAPPLYSAPPPAPLPPPCCPCSSLLHRLLSAHRLEVRRLLRGAVASLGRRLDSLERRSRRKRRKKMGRGQRGGGACSPASTVFTSSASSCSPAPIPLVTTASSSSASSDSDGMPAPPLLSSFGQSEQRRGRGRDDDDEEENEGMMVRGRKRRRKTRREQVFKTENREEEEKEEEEEEDGRRFIGQMAVSVRGGGGGAGEERLTLQNFNQKKHKRRVEGGVNQSEKSAGVVIRQNGFRTELLLHSVPGSSSHDALRLLQLAHSVPTCSQSVAVTPTLTVSSGQWRYSDFAPPRFPSTNHSAFRRWLPSSSFSFRPAPMLRLSVVAMETLADIVKGGSCGSPLRPLKDWTAPPSLSSDHCYVRSLTLSSTFSTRRQQKQRANHSTRSVHLPRRRALPLPSCSANGLSDLFPASQSATSSEFLSAKGERAKRVSQIRIRRASPRETPLTPMGLPKVKRLKKKEFSLEEIYTNKNYKSPTSNRSLETIFEEPREKDGALLLIGQQRRRRLLLFPDFTQPRKRKRPQGVGLPVTTVPRKRAAARRHCHGDSGDVDADLDVMLVERLSALEDFLTRQGLDV